MEFDYNVDRWASKDAGSIDGKEKLSILDNIFIFAIVTSLELGTSQDEQQGKKKCNTKINRSRKMKIE